MAKKLFLHNWKDNGGRLHKSKFKVTRITFMILQARIKHKNQLIIDE